MSPSHAATAGSAFGWSTSAHSPSLAASPPPASACRRPCPTSAPAATMSSSTAAPRLRRPPRSGPPASPCAAARCAASSASPRPSSTTTTGAATAGSAAASSMMAPRSSMEDTSQSPSTSSRFSSVAAPSATVRTCVGRSSSTKARSWEMTTIAPSLALRPTPAPRPPHVQVVRRLVEDQDVLRRQDEAGQRDARLLAARERADEAQRHLALEPQRAAEDLPDALLARHVVAVAPLSPRRPRGPSCPGAAAGGPGGSSPTSALSSSMRSPPTSGMAPARALISVDLPAPFAPRTTRRISRSIVRSAFFTMTVASSISSRSSSSSLRRARRASVSPSFGHPTSAPARAEVASSA